MEGEEQGEYKGEGFVACNIELGAPNDRGRAAARRSRSRSSFPCRIGPVGRFTGTQPKLLFAIFNSFTSSSSSF